MNKTILGFILGAVSVILVFSIFSFASAKWPWGNNPNLAPAQVNAHACNADGICEVNTLTSARTITSSGGLTASNSPNPGTPGTTTPGTPGSTWTVLDRVQVLGQSYLSEVYFGSDPAIGSGISSIGPQYWNLLGPLYLSQQQGGTGLGIIMEISQGDIKFPQLTGTGNDYACLDAQGKLFRSNTAC